MSALLLPFFPLALCAFEQEELRLHIFEPRYKQLINACIEENLVFGIPVVLDKKSTKLGAALRVSNVVKRYETGEMDIICVVDYTFDIVDFLAPTNDKLYGSGWVKKRDFTNNEDNELNLRIQDLLGELYALTGNEEKVNFRKDFSMLPYIHKAAMDINEEMEMWQLTKFSERQIYFVNHLKKTIKTISELNRMNELILLNGHFKKIVSEF